MSLFKKKDQSNDTKPVKFEETPMNFRENLRSNSDPGIIFTSFLQGNDGVNICAEACACCWDTKLPDQYDKREEYIAKRTRIGHGSVTEHSNTVFYLEVPDAQMEDMVEVISRAKYLNTCCKHSKTSNASYLIIGGSWRAYNDLIKRFSKSEMADNMVFMAIMNLIYEYCDKCGFEDLIKDDIIEDRFQNTIMSNSNNGIMHTNIDQDLEIVNCDNFPNFIKELKEVCKEPELFTEYDLLDFCTITVLFKNMSRIITQQLVRHRNAITQESQRYVNYSHGAFNSPAKFKDKYDPDFKYSIQFGRSSMKMTLQEIGDAIASIYGQLTDKTRTQNHDLQLEDARAFLPNNIQCGKIYMTFTWRTFFAFLYLREDLHAQVEIRTYAKRLCEWFRSTFTEYNDCYEALKPKAINESHYCYSIGTTTNTEEVNEAISEEEIVSRMEEQIAYESKEY